MAVLRGERMDIGNEINGRKQGLCASLAYLSERLRRQKMILTTFHDAFHSKFKAIDVRRTYHGYKNCFITGFLSRGDEALEIYMDIFYRGDFIYRVREE